MGSLFILSNMISFRYLAVVVLGCAPLAAQAESDYAYSELDPQRDGYLEYQVIPVDRMSGFVDDPGADIQGQSHDEVEVRASAVEGLLREERNYPEVPVDRISDINPDPKNYYRQLQSGDFDSEAMYEVLPRSIPGMQLPEPTIIPAGPMAQPPVNTIPAQRIVEIKPSGEERIFQQLTPGAQSNAKTGIQSLLSRQPRDAAATTPVPAAKRRLVNPPAVSISEQ